MHTRPQHLLERLKQQVMRGDRRRQRLTRRLDKLHGIARGDVLEHHLQSRHAFNDAAQHAVDEHVLAVEDVDVARGHFAVHLQHLQTLVEQEGSDLHLKVPSQPLCRLNGELVPIAGTDPLTLADTEGAAGDLVVPVRAGGVGGVGDEIVT